MQTNLGLIIFTIVILIFSVIMHEIAHGYAALMLGDQTAKRAGRLTLNPLSHIDLFGSILVPALLVLSNTGVLFGWAKPIPYNPYNLRNQRWGEAIVAAAGILTNFFLAVLFALVTRAALADGATLFSQLAATVVLVNLSLACFNLIPVPPLDGYTVLRGVLPARASLALRDFEATLMRGGIVTIIIVLVVFSYFLSEPFYVFVQWLFALLTGSHPLL